MSGNEKDKCNDCGWIWSHKDDFCPNCGSADYIDFHDRTCDCEECKISDTYKGKKTMQELIKKLRKKLKDDRRTLKWWHGEYVGKLYKYNYFIRQINTPDSIKPDLKDIISEFVG